MQRKSKFRKYRQKLSNLPLLHLSASLLKTYAGYDDERKAQLPHRIQCALLYGGLLLGIFILSGCTTIKTGCKSDCTQESYCIEVCDTETGREFLKIESCQVKLCDADNNCIENTYYRETEPAPLEKIAASANVDIWPDPDINIVTITNR